MDFKTIFINTRQEIALHFLIIELIKAEQIIKINNVIILGEYVVSCFDMSYVSKIILFSHDQHSYLDSLLA